MVDFNGVSMMKELYWSKPDGVLACDSSLHTLAGVNFFHKQFFRLEIADTCYAQCHIHRLEMLALVTCVKLWGDKLDDNMCAVKAINSGKSKDHMC